MIIGKFLDPRAPSLPQQVGINTDDIAEILQENEEQSANIQQNTDDIELLKQQVSESGTRVKVDGELVAEWSPDELTDDLQQLRLAQSSDSLAIVGLQSDNITNKNNISTLQSNVSTLQSNVSDLQGNVSSLNQTMQRTLKVPLSYPPEIELVGVDDNGSQIMVQIDSILSTTSENPIQNKVIAEELKTDVLWQNGSPNSSFALQTITNILDMSKYKYIVVEAKFNDTTVASILEKVPYIINGTASISRIDDNYVGRAFRIVSATSMYFDDAYRSGTKINSHIIPYRIYGTNIL